MPSSGCSMKATSSAPFGWQARLALLHFFEPVGGWLHRKVRRVVGQVQEKRGFILGPFLHVIHRPLGKQIRGVARRVDGLLVFAHIVDVVAAFVHVVVHHVAEPAVEVVEAALGGRVGRFQAQVPLADDGRVVARPLQERRQQRGLGVEVAPTVFGVGADDARHAHVVLVAAREQGGAGGRADGAVGVEVVEAHPVPGDLVHVGRPQVFGAVVRHVVVALVVGQDEEDVG